MALIMNAGSTGLIKLADNAYIRFGFDSVPSAQIETGTYTVGTAFSTKISDAHFSSSILINTKNKNTIAYTANDAIGACGIKKDGTSEKIVPSNSAFNVTDYDAVLVELCSSGAINNSTLTIN